MREPKPFVEVAQNLDLVISMDDGEYLTDVIVVAKVHNMDTGEVTVRITATPGDWITRIGMMAVAMDSIGEHQASDTLSGDDE